MFKSHKEPQVASGINERVTSPHSPPVLIEQISERRTLLGQVICGMMARPLQNGIAESPQALVHKALQIVDEAIKQLG